MKISQVRLSVVIHDWDNEKLVEEKFNELLKDIEKDKIEIKKNTDKGLISYKLSYLYTKIEKKKYIDIFLKNLLEKGLDINELEKNINFDENSNVYFRIDKEDLIKNDRIRITYGDNTFQVRIGIDGYKKDNEKVKEFIINYIKNLK